jgi:probable O-glycosylation ligase (exosortase A-associated)
MRRVTLGIIPLTMMTIMATHSRGAFLATGMTAVVVVWRSRNRVAGFALLAFVFVAGWLAVPQSYKERISTIGSFEEDSSARGRLEAWKVAGRMIVANPLLGVGFSKFQQNYRAYDPNQAGQDDGALEAAGTRVAHNSYLQIWAECGTPAFLLYLTLIGYSFIDIWRVRAQAKRRYHSSWILSYATMFEASLVAFVVGSFFLNRAQFDLFYHFVAIVVVFGRVAREAMADPRAYPVKSGERGPLTIARERGFGARPKPSGFERRPHPSGFGAKPVVGT